MTKNTVGALSLATLAVDSDVKVVIVGTAQGETIDDTFRAAAGIDILNGHNGNDVFQVQGIEALSDTMNGGAGSDALKATGTARVMLANFNAATLSIEVWEGNGKGLEGTAGVNVFNLSGLTGKSGLSSISGLAGVDTVTGSKFADTIAASGTDAQFDTMNGGLGTDTFRADGAAPVTLNGFNAASQSIEAWGGNGQGLLGNGNANVFNMAALTGKTGLASISGLGGNDTITGSKFADTMAASGTDAQFDTMNGGFGTDTFRVDGSGPLTMNGFNAASQSIEVWDGNGQGVVGNANANVFNFAGLTGVSDLPFVDGGAGNDTITGSKFADAVRGGLGKDTMTGGLGGDRFDFDAVAEIGKKKGLLDVIIDWGDGDTIDLSSIDANGAKKGDKAFKFLKKEGADFTGKAGQLAFDQKKGTTFVQGDTNGNGKADFKIEVADTIDFVKADFVL